MCKFIFHGTGRNGQQKALFPPTPAPSLCHQLRASLWLRQEGPPWSPGEEDARKLRAEGQAPGDRVLMASLRRYSDHNSLWLKHRRLRGIAKPALGGWECIAGDITGDTGHLLWVVRSGFTPVCEYCPARRARAGPAAHRRSRCPLPTIRPNPAGPALFVSQKNPPLRLFLTAGPQAVRKSGTQKGWRCVSAGRSCGVHR